MGITKTDIYEKDINRVAQLAKAFSHPARVRIIKHLLEVKGCIVNDLVQVVGLSQATISQHLRELKDIGIIKGEIEGPRMCYCINESVWQEAKSSFLEIFTAYVPSNDCC